MQVQTMPLLTQHSTRNLINIKNDSIGLRDNNITIDVSLRNSHLSP